MCVFVRDSNKKRDRESQQHLSHLYHESIQKCQSLESQSMEIESHGVDEALPGLSGGLMYHTSFIAILQTEQSLTSSRVQVLRLILFKRAPNKAGLKLVFHSRNWPVPRTQHTLTGGGPVSLSALKVQLFSELLLAFQSRSRNKINHKEVNAATHAYI